MDIEILHKTFRNEVAAATQSFFAWKAINNAIAYDHRIYSGIYPQALIWNIALSSMQTNFFISLGRLFDEDDLALSVNSFLSKCLAHLDQFDGSHLRARKIRDSHRSNPPWLDEYMLTTISPSKADIRFLKKKTKSYRSRYNLIYRPIRNKVMAHRELSTIETTDQLFEATQISEIEEMLCFFNQLVKVIWEYLANGRKTELSDHRFDEEAYVTGYVENLLDRLKT